MGFLPLLFLFLFFLVICIILIFFVLMQKGKGDGLAGLMGGMAAADGLGTPEAQKDLGRWTAYMSGLFFIVCLAITLISARCGGPIDATNTVDDVDPPAPAEAPAPDDVLPEPEAEPVSDEVTVEIDLGAIIDDMENTIGDGEEAEPTETEPLALEVETDSTIEEIVASAEEIL